MSVARVVKRGKILMPAPVPINGSGYQLTVARLVQSVGDVKSQLPRHWEIWLYVRFNIKCWATPISDILFGMMNQVTLQKII